MRNKLIISITLLISLWGCKSLKRARLYHSNAPIESNLIEENPIYKIGPGDIFSIFIQDINPETYTFLIPQTSPQLNIKAFSDSYVKGMKVGDSGFLKLPFLDSIYVNDYTIPQLTDTLSKKISSYIKNPNIHVRLLNFNITTLGEFVKPDVYKSINGETFTLNEVISMAGGLKINASRKLILIRKENDKNVKYLIDLNSLEAAVPNSIYLKNGDILYAQETRRSFINNDLQILGIVLNSIASLLTIYLILSR